MASSPPSSRPDRLPYIMVSGQSTKGVKVKAARPFEIWTLKLTRSGLHHIVLAKASQKSALIVGNVGIDSTSAGGEQQSHIQNSVYTGLGGICDLEIIYYKE